LGVSAFFFANILFPSFATVLLDDQSHVDVGKPLIKIDTKRLIFVPSAAKILRKAGHGE
jgi:hypothetical protein